MPGKGFVFAAFEYPCMTINEIIQYTTNSVPGTFYYFSDSRFDLVWFRLSCDHGWIRSGSVNVRNGVLYCFWIMKILIIMVLCSARFNYCIVFVFIV